MLPANLARTRRRSTIPWRGALRLSALWLVACWQRGRERRTLAELDDRMLRDIGITRADVSIETAKPFWKR